jgi:hypothetical protein
VKLFSKLNQMTQGPADTVEPPADDGVALPRHREELGQFRSIRPRARCCLNENTVASRRPERIDLQIVNLRPVADTRITKKNGSSPKTRWLAGNSESRL